VTRSGLRRPGWWLYVLECRSGVLYTGVAKDVEARFAAHVGGKGAKFTRANRPVAIVGKARLRSKGKALRAEYAFKQLRRADKLRWCTVGLAAFVRILS
jgi:predicted GIY-YIG superfamily endonuclease